MLEYDLRLIDNGAIFLALVVFGGLAVSIIGIIVESIREAIRRLP